MKRSIDGSDLGAEVSVEEELAAAVNVEEALNENEEQAIVPVQSQQSSIRDVKIGAFDGELQQDDFSLPYLKIVQPTGESSGKFSPGSLIVGDVLLAQANIKPDQFTDPVKLIMLRLEKNYVEWTDFASKIRGRRVKTEKEVTALGGVVTDQTHINNGWNRELRCNVLVLAESDEAKAGANISDPFGNSYIMALWTLTRSSYSVAKKIITASATILKKGSHTWTWEVRARKEKYGKGLVYIPTCTLLKENDKNLVAWLEGL